MASGVIASFPSRHQATGRARDFACKVIEGGKAARGYRGRPSPLIKCSRYHLKN